MVKSFLIPSKFFRYPWIRIASTEILICQPVILFGNSNLYSKGSNEESKIEIVVVNHHGPGNYEHTD